MTKLSAIQNAFFNAMIAGYASDGKKTKLKDMPGMKGITYDDGTFHVADIYTVSPSSNKSAGMTTIWHHRRPVWLMQYGGFYQERAVEFLKKCLSRAYADRVFIGGRGPRSVEDTFKYENRVSKNEFSDFHGEEFVYDQRGQCLGFHWYRGMSLLK